MSQELPYTVARTINYMSYKQIKSIRQRLLGTFMHDLTYCEMILFAFLKMKLKLHLRSQ